jgi:hypothetical protein
MVIQEFRSSGVQEFSALELVRSAYRELLNSFITSFPILRLFDGYKKAANGSFKKKETE